jgi:hypothetical protein
VAADLVEEELQRVGGDVRERGVVDGGDRRGLAPAVVAQGDPAGVELLVQPAEVRLLELERLREFVHLAEREASAILAAVEQRVECAVERVLSRGHPCVYVTGTPPV